MNSLLITRSRRILKAVKEDQLDSASPGHRHSQPPLYNSSCLLYILCLLHVPVLRARPHTPALLSSSGTTGSPCLCPSNIKLTAASRGCCSNSRSPTHNAGKERVPLHAWEPTRPAALPRTCTLVRASPEESPVEQQPQPPQSPPKEGGSSQGFPMPCWGAERSQSSPIYQLHLRAVPTAVRGTKVAEHHGGLPVLPRSPRPCMRRCRLYPCVSAAAR